jgi:hypothetical protein
MFDPKVLAIRVNTQVRFPNSDDIRHHVYSFSPAKKFELRLYHGLTAEPIVFERAGKVVLGCNIHDSMVAYIYVVDTEYFSLSDAAGNLQINTLPAGDYSLELYHPDLALAYPVEKITLIQTKNLIKNIVLTNLKSTSTQSKGDEFRGLF